MSRLDYAGISVNLFGCTLPVIYYGFACDTEFMKRMIWIGIVGFLSFGCFLTTLISKFDKPRYRPIRAAMFIFAGVSTISIFINLKYFRNDYMLEMNPIWWAIGGYCFV